MQLNAKQRPCVLLRNLPKTISPRDVREHFRAQSNMRVDFLRTRSLQPTGTAIVSLPPELRSIKLFTRLEGKIMGGRPIQTAVLSRTEALVEMRRHISNWPQGMLEALDVLTAEPECCVVLRNIPLHTTTEKLEKKLRRSYQLVGELDARIPLTSDGIEPFAFCSSYARLPSGLLQHQNIPAPKSVLKLPAV